MNKVIALVGMAGSGKSEVSRGFEKANFTRVRFGDITDREICQRKLELNEQNERQVREALRREHGMAAYAKLNLPAIDKALESGSVVVDGLYSWEEYSLMKEYYGEKFAVVAVWSSPVTRYRRLARRKERPLTREEAAGRDRAEIEKINKGGPIAMADFTILNETSLEDLRRNTERIIEVLR
jgi:dephospho-CoA kinase